MYYIIMDTSSGDYVSSQFDCIDEAMAWIDENYEEHPCYEIVELT